MTAHAIEPAIEARIDQDFAAKTGPFALAILTAHHVSSHYDVHCVPAAQLLDRLAARKVYAALTLWVLDPALKSKPGEAMAHYLARTPAILHDAETLEVLNRPLSRFQLGGGTAETEALIVADFQGRNGLFVRPVVVAGDLIKFYGEEHFRTARMAGNMLSEVSLRALNAQALGVTIRLHVVHDDPELMVMKPRELLNVFRQGRGLPPL